MIRLHVVFYCRLIWIHILWVLNLIEESRSMVVFKLKRSKKDSEKEVLDLPLSRLWWEKYAKFESRPSSMSVIFFYETRESAEYTVLTHIGVRGKPNEYVCIFLLLQKNTTRYPIARRRIPRSGKRTSGVQSIHFRTFLRSRIRGRVKGTMLTRFTSWFRRRREKANLVSWINFFFFFFCFPFYFCNHRIIQSMVRL